MAISAARFPINHSVGIGMILRKTALYMALVMAGVLIGYSIKPSNGLQVTAGQLISCGKTTIPTIEM
ncbi:MULTISPECIES: hypothetical protein [Pseudomonas]|uniref:Uncharacterized protein n=1 Tax=Pseudomonas sp. W17 TaxID=3144407 RepID=A0AAU7WN34_9PSED|nr:hypothetical protein [Pseudomonas protegens]WRV89440.1 hypothetical protein VP719_21150 [Pseudomonas protegens]